MEEKRVKNVLINTIQAIEKQTGFKKVDSEETIVNMALVYLYNSFDIGLALDYEEVKSLRNKLQEDLKIVEKEITGSV